METSVTRTDDGSVIGPDGTVLYFSADRFARDICEGTCCFLCGAARGSRPFNREHILPDWLLRRYHLKDREITLPNGRTHQYGSYVVPCCKHCNCLLGRELETPLSSLLGKGHDAVAAALEAEGPHRLFTWMALIFLKTHLRDATLRAHEHFQQGDDSIATAANYRWEAFHHLHCLARSIYTGAIVQPAAFGSLLLLPTLPDEDEPFDLVDLSEAQTFLIRMDDFALYAVFDDSCAVLHGIDPLLERIEAPLDVLQAREMAAHVACANMHLENRPQFHTRIVEGDPPRVVIDGTHAAAPVFAPRDARVFGACMTRVLGEILPELGASRWPPEELARLLAEGKISVMFGDHGGFIRRG